MDLLEVEGNVAKKMEAAKVDEAATTIEDVYQTLILKEVLLAEGLKADLEKAKAAEWLGEALSKPASIAVDVVSAKVNRSTGKLASVITKAAINQMFEGDRALSVIRSGRELWQRVVGDDESTAHSCCRAALAFALSGNYVEAEHWLEKAESHVNDLARPKIIRGLIAGATGRPDDSRRLLTKALKGRAKAETKERIRDAASALLAGRTSAGP
ncbi:MAG: hypothetical protein HYV07_14115 [Deltaproteobacteria bacterium]|nr:hypothetical protein [Deltaproteobacteria bacterium]